MTARTWAQTVDAARNQFLNPVIHPTATAPTTPVAGQVWYDTVTGKFMYRDGVAGANIDARARANHTGTQAASTISDLAAVVQAYRLDQFAVPTASLNLNSNKLLNVVDPTNPQEAATKNYVDLALAASLAGTSYKDPVRVATTTNGTLATAFANGQTVDGIVLATGNRILIKNQSAAAENGIYTVNGAGAPTRAADANLASELQGGVIVAVDEGTAGNNTAWMLSVDVTTLGTDPITWIPFGVGQTYTASLGVQLVGNDIRANLGTGLTLSGNQIVPSYGGSNIMQRKVYSAAVGTTGADITITTGFTVANKFDHIVQVYEQAGGSLVDVGVVCLSTTQVTLSFAVTPTNNQYYVVIQGLS